MKKLMTFVAVLSLTSVGWAASGREATTDRLDHAGAVLHEIMSAPDKGIPEEVLEHAKCIAVVPHLLKGGFIFGAENGRGVATCRTAAGWSAPAFFTITGGSWGLQIGVEGVDLVMVVQNDRGMQHLINSNFELGADASAAAGPVGRHASADTDWKLESSRILAPAALLPESRSTALPFAATKIPPRPSTDMRSPLAAFCRAT